MLSLDGVVERLRDLLPPTFEDLQTEFAGLCEKGSVLQLLHKCPQCSDILVSLSLLYQRSKSDYKYRLLCCLPAVGVVSAETGQHLLIDSGPLPEAVAASAAIPWLFQAVDIPGAFFLFAV